MALYLYLMCICSVLITNPSYLGKFQLSLSLTKEEVLFKMMVHFRMIEYVIIMYVLLTLILSKSAMKCFILKSLQTFAKH